eukprot:jgi/Tetstr1/440119/TSEL_028477.t1
MSSFKQVLRRTYATRKKTLKRRVDAVRRGVAALADADADDDDTDTAAAAGDNVATAEAEACGAKGDVTLAFIAASALGARREGYVFKAGPRGLGYYRDDGGGGGGDTAGDVGLGWAVRERITLTADGEEGMEGAIAAYKRVRARDGRQKARVVVIVGDCDKPLSRLPPRFGAPQVKTKQVSKLGVGSASKSKFAYAGVGLLHSKVDDRAIRELLTQYRSGKLSTLFVTDECVHWLPPLADKTAVLLQVSKLPALSVLQTRRRVLLGGSPTPPADQSTKRAWAFFSRPIKAAAVDRAVVRQLRREGHELPDLEMAA